jgi:hypothetical protein
LALDLDDQAFRAQGFDQLAALALDHLVGQALQNPARRGQQRRDAFVGAWAEVVASDAQLFPRKAKTIKRGDVRHPDTLDLGTPTISRGEGRF